MRKSFFVLFFIISLLRLYDPYTNLSTDTLAPATIINTLELLTYRLNKIFQNQDIKDKRKACTRALTGLHYFKDSKIENSFYYRPSLIWFVDEKRSEVWSFHLVNGTFKVYRKPLHPVQAMAKEFLQIDWESFVNGNDDVRVQLKDKIAQLNRDNSAKLTVFIGRISKEICQVGKYIYIPLALDDELFGLIVKPESKKVEIHPLRRQRELEIKARINSLRKKYQTMIPKGIRIWQFINQAARIIEENKAEIQEIFNTRTALSPEERASIATWFDLFIMNRDHGFLHALKDLEFILEQIKQADEHGTKFKGQPIKIEAINLRELILATLLHDTASIIRRKDHHLTGEEIGHLILGKQKYHPSNQALISNMILRHRGNDYLPPLSLEEHLLAYADELTATEVGTRLYYHPHDLPHPWLDERISFAYRMMTNMGIFQHEFRTPDQKPDPATFHLYSLIMRGMEETANITYGDFEPIKLLLPHRIDTEVASLQRQIQFDARYDQQTIETYNLFIDAFIECAGLFFKINHVRTLFETYKELMPLFAAPPYTTFSEDEDWSKHIRPQAKEAFYRLPTETQKEILQTVSEIFKILNIMEPQFQRSLQAKFFGELHKNIASAA